MYRPKNFLLELMNVLGRLDILAQLIDLFFNTVVVGFLLELAGSVNVRELAFGAVD